MERQLILDIVQEVAKTFTDENPLGQDDLPEGRPEEQREVWRLAHQLHVQRQSLLTAVSLLEMTADDIDTIRSLLVGDPERLAELAHKLVFVADRIRSYIG